MEQQTTNYYVPAQSHWPIIGAIGLLFIAIGAGMTVQQMTSEATSGGWLLTIGIVIILYMMFGWFNDVIKESDAGLYSAQMDRSFRQGMSWFIFSEVMFFAAFFGALFYIRFIAIPWLGGASNNEMTGQVLWPNFEAIWPLTTTPAGDTTQAMGWQGLPLYNTIILLASSITLHFAHVGLEQNKRKQLTWLLLATVILGGIFLFLQAEEYVHAYREMGLTLSAGTYGNTFFLLTGFHGLHVTIGTLMLFVMLVRVIKGHFSPERHFAFQATSWYWHFVDVVWLGLFFFVYVI
ncbi:cytochrome c oxidase subunit 3 [Psychrobium sp. MM17-31]|uniref:cytochrome c oxidase subunit 3 n=1 Tax=Psychrobium sp. MM17-31 TaxID=2917758 RepID=UPI001EF557D4|nr:cytochrome c oxidase subunit 3 [Psychrobium sp. MM17-31]MCG7530627.1 cytochrome c oxidase subunit 3 [Psychrobium sp. MM17-31]